MKKICNILLTLLLVAACAPVGRDINYNIIPGSGLYFPESDIFVDLSTGKSVSFEWGPAMAEDNGYVSYEVVFDRVGGDFSAPVGRVASQIGGSKNYVTISAKTLSRIARAAGIGIFSQGSLQWSVRASKGLGGVIYPTPRRLNVRTINSMDPLPTAVTLSGSAMEADTKMVLSRGIDGSGVQEGVFEMFGKISSGTFTVSDDQGRYYALNSTGTISSSATPVNNTLSASELVRWLQLDFDGMTWSEQSIQKVEYYAACWSDNQMTTDYQTMTYEGKGVWKLLNYPNTISLNNAGDSRHRFNMTLADTDETKIYLGTGLPLGVDYTTDYLRVNFYTADGVGSKDWDKTWNYLPTDCGRKLDIYLYLNADNEAGSWWHEYRFKD